MSVHLMREIESLKKKLLALGAAVEESVWCAVQSVEERDAALAARIIEGDAAIDRVEVEIEEECLKILALHQPVAVDLRFVVAVLKINNDLERIGDLAVNIAERGLFLARQPGVSAPGLLEMARKVQRMLSRSLNALVDMNPALAREVCAADDEVDALNRQVCEYVKASMCRGRDGVDILVHVLSVSRDLERVADHATNIAEDVVYMVEGRIARHRTEDRAS